MRVPVFDVHFDGCELSASESFTLWQQLGIPDIEARRRDIPCEDSTRICGPWKWPMKGR